MDPAGILGTGTVEDQRSYIKIETSRGKKLTEIHTWKAKKSTDERSVKLVADALEEDCHVTCEEFSEATGISQTSPRHDGVLDGIIELPRHWDSVIEKQGDYSEGL
ncbi:hypothetical protein L9F63_013504 [Diploptera punctata]|uniref:Uncharacterized protein n=1 Tax=Diploptera punctata TaxID=6984 RepID=A0AAD8ELL4_DIPPU|nr:hypothetical protein L9F63_013504 [Diploptera punctata]